MLNLEYGDNTVTLMTVYTWYERFKSSFGWIVNEQNSRQYLISKTAGNV